MGRERDRDRPRSRPGSVTGGGQIIDIGPDVRVFFGVMRYRCGETHWTLVKKSWAFVVEVIEYITLMECG